MVDSRSLEGRDIRDRDLLSRCAGNTLSTFQNCDNSRSLPVDNVLSFEKSKHKKNNKAISMMRGKSPPSDVGM